MLPVRANVRSFVQPSVTIALIAANVVAFLFEWLMPPHALDAFILHWGVVPVREMAALAHAPDRLDLWLSPIFSSMFLHGGWAHLLGNMIYLWVFGRALEGRIGHVRFGLLYLAGGIVASQAQVLMAATSHAPMVGASGA